MTNESFPKKSIPIKLRYLNKKDDLFKILIKLIHVY